jgi:NADPH:quinone reductase-like Zn-dependent oxidoreductase
MTSGAGGGVGTFAVQVAKWLGAEVTAAYGPGNGDTVRSLGTDRVIDYRAP